LSVYLAHLNNWFSIFESPDEINSIFAWKEKRKILIETVKYISTIEDCKYQLKSLQSTLIATDSLVKNILRQMKSTILSRLSTLNCEHYFSLMRSKDYHLDVYRYFQHSAQLRQVFVILHQDEVDVPFPKPKDTKYYSVTNAMTFKREDVNKYLLEIYHSKVKNNNHTDSANNNDDEQNIDAKNNLLTIKKNSKRQTVREGSSNQQYDSVTNLEQAKWLKFVDTLLSFTIGQRQSSICLMKDCKRLPLKNNANFIRHLTRVHSLGPLAHFASAVFECLNNLGQQVSFDCNNLEEVLINKVEELKLQINTSSQISQNNLISQTIPSSQLEYLSTSESIDISLYKPLEKAFLLDKNVMNGLQAVVFDLEWNLDNDLNISEIYMISVVQTNQEFHCLINCEEYVQQKGKYRNGITSIENAQATKRDDAKSMLIDYLDLISKGFDKIALFSHNGKKADYPKLYKFLNGNEKLDKFEFSDGRNISFIEFDTIEFYEQLSGNYRSIQRACDDLKIQYKEEDLHRASVDVYFLFQIITGAVEKFVKDDQSITHYIEQYFLYNQLKIINGPLAHRCFDLSSFKKATKTFLTSQFDLWKIPERMTKKEFNSWNDIYGKNTLFKVSIPKTTKGQEINS
jgi:hypothetical protein